MFKIIKMENHITDEKYFNGKLPSKSFTKKLCSAVSVQLKPLIKDIKHKENFTEMITLSYGDFPFKKYDASNPYQIHIRIEAKNMALVLAEGYVIWRTQKAEFSKIIFPWSDVSNVDLFFRLRLESCEVRKLNWVMAELPLPMQKSKDTGLSYDYQIETMEPDGQLIITSKNELSDQDILTLENSLFQFYDNYNKANEEKIHYIGDFTFKKNKAYVDIDAGSSDISVIEECIFSFSRIDFIKKIVFL